MFTFFVRRLILAVPTLLGISLVVFSLMQITPGDPARLMAGPYATEKSVEELRETLGLDEPVAKRYLLWVGRVVQGDLGRSVTFRRPIGSEILDKAGATAILVLAAILIAGVGGLTLGLISGMWPRSRLDRISRIISLFGISMPEFWLGMILVFFFSSRLGLLPVSGMQSAGATAFDLPDTLRHLVLPAITLSVPQLAIVARLTRSTLLTVMSEDYILTARSKGLREVRQVLGIHALRNALIPIITILGWQFGFLLGATVFVEVVFGWPGLGQLTVIAAASRDVALLQGIALVIGAVVVCANIIVDASYTFIDPRVKVQ